MIKNHRCLIFKASFNLSSLTCIIRSAPVTHLAQSKTTRNLATPIVLVAPGMRKHAPKIIGFHIMPKWRLVSGFMIAHSQASEFNPSWFMTWAKRMAKYCTAWYIYIMFKSDCGRLPIKSFGSLSNPKTGSLPQSFIL